MHYTTSASKIYSRQIREIAASKYPIARKDPLLGGYKFPTIDFAVMAQPR
jgi:hypothetical protein